MRNWPFAKGHGTQNDFVIVNDRHLMYDPSPHDVRFLCDRHAGVGGDGVLRVVRAAYVDGWDGDGDLWFMDYRNADGSVAETCGNGIRVFARYLVEEGLAIGEQIPIATRAGLRIAHLIPPNWVRVEMGRPRITGTDVTVELDGLTWPATGVDVGNPHAVAEVSEAELVGLDLHKAPDIAPADVFPNGVNVEFARLIEPGQIAMRVHERGSGETRSCGTGTVAVAVALAARTGDSRSSWSVEVPGGRVEVGLADDGSATLAGPAEIVAHGEVQLPDREAVD